MIEGNAIEFYEIVFSQCRFSQQCIKMDVNFFWRVYLTIFNMIAVILFQHSCKQNNHFKFRRKIDTYFNSYQ